MPNPRARIEIDAPLDTVWSVMLDVDAYGEWNPFLFKAECSSPPEPGDPITLHVRWPNGKVTTSPERIHLVEHPADVDGVRRATLAYDYEGLPSKLGLVKGRRYQRLTQVPGGPCVYDTVEEFSGPLVRFAGPARVEAGFVKHAEGLKKRSESLR